MKTPACPCGGGLQPSSYLADPARPDLKGTYKGEKLLQCSKCGKFWTIRDGRLWRVFG